MDYKAVFPLSVKSKTLSQLAIAIVSYIAISVIAGIVLGLLGALTPLIGFVFVLIGWIIRLYCGVGSLIAILVFFQVI